MDFRSFIQRDIDHQTDPGILSAAAVIMRLEDLPPSSDPRVLAQALYKLLDPQATKGFQVSMMIYNQIEPANELPADLKKDPAKFLAAINHIVDLQNDDPDYRWPSPMHQQRFGKRR